MRHVLALAAILTLSAGAVHAQFQPIQPIPPIPPIPQPTMPREQTFKPYAPPKPYEGPKPPNVYASDPFSPAAEAKRERRANAPPPGGPFSPEQEAKRERAEAKRSAQAASPF